MYHFSEKTNESLHSLKSEIAETKYDQLKLSAAILSLEWFRNNISSGLIGGFFLITECAYFQNMIFKVCK